VAVLSSNLALRVVIFRVCVDRSSKYCYTTRALDFVVSQLLSGRSDPNNVLV
jgi:hypothetical protein